MDWDFDFSDDFDSLGSSIPDVASSVSDYVPNLDFSAAFNSYYDNPLVDSGYTDGLSNWSPDLSGAADFGDYRGFVDQLGGASVQGVGGETGPSFMDQADSSLQKIGNYLGTPGGKMIMSLGGGALSAMDAMKKQAMMKKAQKMYQQQLAARQAKAQAYDAPLRLAFERTKSANPSVGAGGSEAQFFTGNKLPSYYAEGGSAEDRGGPLGFIKYMIAGKRLPSEIREAEEAKRKALLQSQEGTMMEGAAKLGDRRRMLEEMEKSQGLASGQRKSCQ
jgi:hypothetical protein